MTSSATNPVSQPESEDELDLDSLHEEADPWYPHTSKGKAAGQPDTITGELIELAAIEDVNKDLKIRATLRERNGKVWGIRTYPTVLHSAWMRAQPLAGETVSIRFRGMIKNPARGKSDYPDFSLKVLGRGTPTPFDYSRLGGGPPVAEPEPDVPLDTGGLEDPLPWETGEE